MPLDRPYGTSTVRAVNSHENSQVSSSPVMLVRTCGIAMIDLHDCCRMGESLLNDMAAVSLEDPAQAKEAEIEKAPPLAFGAVVKKQHKWQVMPSIHHAPQ